VVPDVDISVPLFFLVKLPITRLGTKGYNFQVS
jgi:hypothetical protein